PGELLPMFPWSSPGDKSGAVFSVSSDLTVQMTRYTVNHDRRYIALDQRAYIVYKFVCHIGSLFVYPLTRNELFVVSDLVDVLDLCSALIWIIGNPVQNDHLAGITLVGSLHSGASDLGCLQDIDTGCTVGR